MELQNLVIDAGTAAIGITVTTGRCVAGIKIDRPSKR